MTALLLLAAAAGGTALAGDDPFATLAAYDQPWFALPTGGWVVVGIVYYLGIGVVGYRLLRRLPGSRAAVALVVAVVAANEAWNVLVFRIAAPWLATGGLVAFTILVAATLAVVRRHDAVGARILVAYLGWLVLYDLPWIAAIALGTPT